MTYIEFFDKQAVENIGASLTNPPDRVIFVGNAHKKMEKFAENCRKLFAARGQEIEFLYRTASKTNLDHAIAVLTSIVEEYDDCVFDVTGGTEILNLALGIVYSKNLDKGIQIHKLNFNNNTIYDYDKDGTTIYKDTPTLSVQENVLIHGGDIVYGDVDSTDTYKWDLNPEFVDDLLAIWSICKKDPRLWNAQIAVFESAERVGAKSEDGLTTTVNFTRLCQDLTRRGGEYKEDEAIIKKLSRFNLITNFKNDKKEMTISYKNKQVKRCLTIAGQALEMRVYLAALESVDDEGKAVYNDVLNGVVIDWDGKQKDEQGVDTENEVDVVMMHGVIPIFVSCKNGFLDSDELYKLHTVAERFGGKYAKKILVTSVLDRLGPSEKHIRQRAADMGIHIIDDVRELDLEQLARELKKGGSC